MVQIFVTRSERETTQVLHSIGPVWDGNEVWLLLLGGALFFAFPALYASAFSGFCLSLMIVLWLLILRGVSIEFRGHINNYQWQQLWGTVFVFANVLPSNTSPELALTIYNAAAAEHGFFVGLF